MNTILWICQGFLALAFTYSGVMKSTQSEAKLVAIGQTGVEGLPLPFIRFIGIAELMGVAGLIIPWWTGVLPILTPIAALCLGTIMVPAAIIHYKRNELKSVVWVNIPLLLICLFTAAGRLLITQLPGLK